MESIAKTAKSGQDCRNVGGLVPMVGKFPGPTPIKPARPPSARVYPFGMHIDSPLKGVKLRTRGAVGEKRGTIEGFSTAARRRMREAMLTLHIPDAELVGLTLTVPWKGDSFGPLMDEFRECVNRFGVTFRRKWPNSSLIYRIELQERGAPHIHALWWRAPTDGRTPGGDACRPLPARAAAGVAAFDIAGAWRAAVPDLHRGSYAAFCRYGVKVEPIEDAGAMFRYLADHASKHKQAQLGYKGKQWGIVGRANLVERTPFNMPAFENPRHEIIFNRLLRKVMRYRIQAKNHPGWKRLPPFGSVLKGSRRVVGDFYLKDTTAIDIWWHAKGLADEYLHYHDYLPF